MKIICLLGPTASGKTQLAMQLARMFPCEIISVDSAMVYRGMDIGTAKPSRSEQLLVPHRLIDLCDPSETYSAGQFCRDARQAIDASIAAGKIPLLVGGTMLYFRLLQKGFCDFPPSDIQTRAAIHLEAQQIGWPALHARLAAVDPETACRIHPNDSQRIERALELWYTTGKTPTVLQSEQIWSELPFEMRNLILSPPDRAVVHERIERRFDIMLEQGLVAEASQFYQRGDLTPEMPSMRIVGYQQLWRYFSGEYDFSTMRAAAIAATRQLAKRQFTWLKQWPDAPVLNSASSTLLDNVIHHICP